MLPIHIQEARHLARRSRVPSTATGTDGHPSRHPLGDDMAAPMNNVIAHTIAVGVIAIVTLFPTPSRLFDAFRPSQATLQFSRDAETVIVASPRVASAPIEVHAPFPLECAENGREGKAVLKICASQLSDYLDRTDTTLREAGARHISLDPRVEQARRALIEICRLRWAMKNPPPDPATDRVCDTL